jgi:(p)ppGpp synthase/HD superfamily hydrolase
MADNDGAHGAMIEQPEDNQQGPVSPGQAYVPNPVAVTLPDGNRREFPHPVTGADLAAAIGPGLAKAAIAIRVDGRMRDLAAVIDRDAAVAIITRDTPEAL